MSDLDLEEICFTFEELSRCFKGVYYDGHS